MKLRGADDPMLTPNSDFRQCLPTTVHYRTALFQFPLIKSWGTTEHALRGFGRTTGANCWPEPFVAQLRAMSLLFSYCRSAEEPGFKKVAGICALRPTGLKMHSYENARSAGPGASKTEPNICHWGVANCSSRRGTSGVLRNYDSVTCLVAVTAASTLEVFSFSDVRFRVRSPATPHVSSGPTIRARLFPLFDGEQRLFICLSRRHFDPDLMPRVIPVERLLLEAKMRH
jgi:hypothetical protein